MTSPLLIDLYQLTMAYGYWKLGMHDREAVFHMIFRKYPFQGNYAVACGLATLIDALKTWHFTKEDIDYLRKLNTPNQTPLFTEDFLLYLKELRLHCDIDAIPEGTVVFPNEPLVRIQGPLIEGQLIESMLLNIINFQTLIATKSSRVRQIAQKDKILEFGMRRAQGMDGALSASRAAYIGGCDATSNVLAGKNYDIPVVGTHAHSWVTAFADEKSAFAAYAEVMPDNCVLLVDTYDTIQGVKNAIAIGAELKSQGATLRGVRLDSGDMATLSKKARQLLDDAGFNETQIIASNSLDEYVIAELKQKHAPISVWGVGTNLVTAYDHPALDGVYKLSALRDEEGIWRYKLKLSEQAVKTSNPGIYQVRRFSMGGKPVMDVMYDLTLGIDKLPELVSLESPHINQCLTKYDTAEDLLVPIFSKGELVYDQPTIHAIRSHAMQQVEQFSKAYPKNYYMVALEKQIHNLKQQLISEVSLNLP